MKKYGKVVRFDKDFQPVPDMDAMNKLPPGMYEVNVNRSNELFFSQITSNHDQLVDLPNTEYDTIVKEIDNFMKQETKDLFEKYGFLYKRSSLLYGKPGTGKTCLVNRIIEKVIKDSGVVLFAPNPKLLEEAFKILDSLQKETRVMVVLEELDELLDRYESELLNLLDGEIQKNNVIFMATTNHIDKIPQRIRRPGRFSTVMEVRFPSESTRRFYLDNKISDKSVDLDRWVKITEGFSIDELKETVLAVLCLGYPIDTVVDRIKANKGDHSMDPKDEDSDGWEDLEPRFVGVSVRKAQSYE